MHTFNSKAPHGVIYGHPVARFEQNGIYFDGSGREVSEERMNQIEESAQVAAEVEEKKKLKDLAEAMPSAVKRRGRPPGSKSRAKQASA
jgi:hypothetical protein